MNDKNENKEWFEDESNGELLFFAPFIFGLAFLIWGIIATYCG